MMSLMRAAATMYCLFSIGCTPHHQAALGRSSDPSLDCAGSAQCLGGTTSETSGDATPACVATNSSIAHEVPNFYSSRIIRLNGNWLLDGLGAHSKVKRIELLHPDGSAMGALPLSSDATIEVGSVGTIAGQIVTCSSGLVRAWSPLGSSAWTVSVAGGEFAELADRAIGGVLYLLGNRTPDTSPGVHTPVIHGIDSNGGVTLVRDSETDLAGYATMPEPLSQGGMAFLLLNETKYGTELGASRIVVVNANGATVWQSQISNSPALGEQALVGGIRDLGANRVAVAYAKSSSADKIVAICVVSFGEGGSPMWRRCTATGEGYWVNVGSLALTLDGDLVTAGSIARLDRNGDETDESWLWRLDANGNTRQLRQIPTLQWDPQVTADDANGFILVRSIPNDIKDFTAGWKSEIQRVDAWGNASCAQSGLCFDRGWSECLDTNPCTADLCDGAHNGCYHVQLPDGATCADSGAHCLNGTCKP